LDYDLGSRLDIVQNNMLVINEKLDAIMKSLKVEVKKDG